MPRQNNHRGQGGGDGRGRGRGRGRGGLNGVPPTVAPVTGPPASCTPRHRYPHASADTDVVTQQWSEPSESTVLGGNANRGRGSWRGGMPKSRSGAGTPSRGAGSGFGRGRGQGQRRPQLGGANFKIKAIFGKDAPLSDLLYNERPLLRPVHFVPATQDPVLFQSAEDMLKSAPPVADTEETSRIPTANLVARLFDGETGRIRPDSDSGPEPESEGDAQDVLEEFDFADLAQVRAEVDAIARDNATMVQDARQDQESIEEVDFADLAAIRAKVDAAQAQETVRDAIIQKTAIRNHVKNTTQVSSTRSYDAQQPALSSTSSTLDESLNAKPFIEVSNSSSDESITARDTIMDEVPCSSNVLPNMLVEEPSLSTAPETRPISAPTGDMDISLHPDAPSHDDVQALFVIDTGPSRPLNSRSASDVILVDRTGYGETLGDQEEERIVYVAPHPRSGHASPAPPVPRVKLPRTSVLTGQSFEVGWLRSPVREEEDASPISNQERMRTDLETEAGEDHRERPSFASLAPQPVTFASTSSQVHPPYTDAAPGARKNGKERRRQRRRKNKRSQLGFGAFGAMMSEARLREEDVKEMHHPRWETRRKGDSDIDWGTEDGNEVGNEVDALSEGLGGMEIDPDLDLDVDAMHRFLKSMSVEGSRFVTMDDIEDEARMQQEDEGSQGGPEGSSASDRSDAEELDEDEKDEEEEEEFNIEEELLIAESDDTEELSEDSDEDDELSPTSNFQARLRKLRERSHDQDRKTTQDISDEEGEEDLPNILPLTRSADDEEFLAHINDLLEENSQILSGSNRKQKKAIFRNLHQGYVDEWDVEGFIDDPEFTTPVNKKKGKKGKGKQATGHFSAELEAQWAKDRAKKAEYKLQRQTARYLAALDPLSAPNGHSSRKAMRAAARLDPDLARAIAPRAIVDGASLEAQIRRFAEDIEGRPSIALPPMDSEVRWVVHQMAEAFGVKSVSKGKGDARYTTLIRTSRTGLAVDEERVRRVAKHFGRIGKRGNGGGDDRKGGKRSKHRKGGGREDDRKGGGRGEDRKGGGRGSKAPRVPKQREGDEVGKEAPKIGEGNVGFRMLASMGWSEGNLIGGTASVGIETPLTAIIKTSKLGLGHATR